MLYNRKGFMTKRSYTNTPEKNIRDRNYSYNLMNNS